MDSGTIGANACMGDCRSSRWSASDASAVSFVELTLQLVDLIRAALRFLGRSQGSRRGAPLPLRSCSRLASAVPRASARPAPLPLPHPLIGPSGSSDPAAPALPLPPPLPLPVALAPALPLPRPCTSARPPPASAASTHWPTRQTRRSHPGADLAAPPKLQAKRGAPTLPRFAHGTSPGAPAGPGPQSRPHEAWPDPFMGKGRLPSRL
jgi:hypothetical protein